jgi:hypothetical protein
MSGFRGIVDVFVLCDLGYKPTMEWRGCSIRIYQVAPIVACGWTRPLHHPFGAHGSKHGNASPGEGGHHFHLTVLLGCWSGGEGSQIAKQALQ